LHFSFLRKEKLRFASVKPSAATLIRVAFGLSNLASSLSKTKRTSEMAGARKTVKLKI